MTWTPGKSANKGGRPKSEAGRTELREAIAKGLPAVIAKLHAMAIDGSHEAAKLLLDRGLPAYKPTAEHMPLPGLLAAASHTEAVQEVLRAVGNGVVPPDTAASLLSAIASAAKVEEVDALRRQVAELYAARFS